MPLRQFDIDGLEKTLAMLESYTLLNVLKLDQRGYVAICRIELKNPDSNLADLAGHVDMIKELKSVYREGNGAH